jgi:DNA-binding NarL/FixJ family response regulator
MERIRVLIADDHPHFREGLAALLSSAADLEVVGEAGTVGRRSRSRRGSSRMSSSWT